MAELHLQAKMLNAKEEESLSLPSDSTPRELREELSRRFYLPLNSFKILVAGRPLKDETRSLLDLGVADGSRLTVALDKWQPSSRLELALAREFAGFKNPQLAALRYQKASLFVEEEGLKNLEEFVASLSLSDLERALAEEEVVE